MRGARPRKRPSGLGNLRLSRVQATNQKGTFMVKRNHRRPRLKITGGGTGIVNHAGARPLADVADVVGLTEALPAAMAPTKQRRRGHDRGRVLVDVAVMIADGGETISDVAVLRDQPDLFGEVASPATVWRTLEGVDDAALERRGVRRRSEGTRSRDGRRGVIGVFLLFHRAAGRNARWPPPGRIRACTRVNRHRSRAGRTRTWQHDRG